ncbi:MAG: hypothetical protein KatS3mg082_2504 [Nitrospiraceae bacterium]|nr:MAG: hypothetical protein KatS3mg082_2504 [Nitrospiraceae bacterium]
MLNVAAAPLLTRLYGPDEMAAWGLLVAFLGMASSVSTLRYDMAIMAARTDEEARAIVVMSIWLTTGTTVVLLGLFELLRQQAWLGFDILPPESLPLVGVGLVAMGLFAPLRYFALRAGRLRHGGTHHRSSAGPADCLAARSRLSFLRFARSVSGSARSRGVERVPSDSFALSARAAADDRTGNCSAPIAAFPSSSCRQR